MQIICRILAKAYQNAAERPKWRKQIAFFADLGPIPSQPSHGCKFSFSAGCLINGNNDSGLTRFVLFFSPPKRSRKILNRGFAILKVGFEYAKGVFAYLKAWFEYANGVSEYLKVGFEYAKGVFEYLKVGFEYAKGVFEYLKVGFEYAKGVSEYFKVGFKYANAVFEYLKVGFEYANAVFEVKGIKKTLKFSALIFCGERGIVFGDP